LKPNCSMQTDNLSDMTKLIFVFRNFAKAPENVCKFTSSLLAKFNFIDPIEEDE
jgi:hypothetical protein